MARKRKSQKPLKRIFNESMVRYLLSNEIRHYKDDDDKLLAGRKIYWYEITPEFNKALKEYVRK